MGVERATFLDGLNPDNPTAYDKLKDGDDHIRMIKQALRNTFPEYGKQVNISATQLNKLHTWLFAVEDQADEPEDLEKFTVLGDAEFRKDIYMTEGKDDPDAPSTPDTPKITGLADIQFTTAEQDDPEQITDEKKSRALNLATADSRYLKVTSEGDIVGGINKLTWKENADAAPVTIAIATEDTLTVKNKVVAEVIQAPDAVAKIDLKAGKAVLKNVEVGSDLRVTGNIFRGSDRRLKEDIQPLKCSGIDSLIPVQYMKQSRKEYGLIAQDIPEEYKHIISTDENAEGLLAVDYTQLIPVLIQEIQELKRKLGSK